MEHTVKIPVRLALLLARNITWEAKKMRANGDEKLAKMFESWKDELGEAVAYQCSDQEISAAFVAVKLEENA
ncbi:MAG: hypothetical protein ABIT70_05730 [Sulfuriferula sp.]